MPATIACFLLLAGPEEGVHTRSYTAWSHELPSELDIASWCPVFVDGIREYDEPYRYGHDAWVTMAGSGSQPCATGSVGWAPRSEAVRKQRHRTTVGRLSESL